MVELQGISNKQLPVQKKISTDVTFLEKINHLTAIKTHAHHLIQGYLEWCNG